MFSVGFQLQSTLTFLGLNDFIIGDDGDNFYVAESLNNYRGVVMKKYAKSKVIKSFPYVVLMDSVYESDGNLTNMWYQEGLWIKKYY